MDKGDVMITKIISGKEVEKNKDYFDIIDVRTKIWGM